MSTSLKRKFSKGVGTTAIQVGGYSAPTVQTGVYVTGLTISNTTASAVTATAWITDGTTQVNLCTNAPVPAGASISLADHGNRQALNSGDQVFAQSSAPGSLDVNMSVMEIQ